MRCPLAERERDRLIEAMLPDVAFDGWSHAALHVAARQLAMPAAEAVALFPGGAPDLVAGFCGWTDRRMLDRFETEAADLSGTTAKVKRALELRFEIVAPWREAVRRSVSVLALPPHAVLGMRLLYDTVDGIWYAAGDTATDFSFYTKRATLAAVYTATLMFWLEDRSEDSADTVAFIGRRLADVARLGAVRSRMAAAIDQLPNPLRLFRPAR